MRFYLSLLWGCTKEKYPSGTPIPDGQAKNMNKLIVTEKRKEYKMYIPDNYDCFRKYDEWAEERWQEMLEKMEDEE